MDERRAVLFDLDGVLVHTELLKGRAHSATVRQFEGADIPLSFYAEVLGQSHERVRSAYLEAGGIDVDAETYTQTYRQIYQRLLRTDLELAPGSLELLRQLSEKGYVLAVVSSSHSRAVNQILDQTGLGEFFDVQVSGDDVDRKKPAPDAYLRALDMLVVPSTSAVVIEDSESGVQAAINAGMRVLAVRHSMNVRHDLTAAYAVLNSLRDTARMVNLIALLLGVGSEWSQNGKEGAREDNRVDH